VTRGRVVRIVGYYRDAGFLERIISIFRKLWIDINWIQARKVRDDGLYEIYMEISDTKNTLIAILNLSKTVNVEKVEVLEPSNVETYVISKLGEIKKVPPEEAKEYDIVIYVPVFSKIIGYSWGEKFGKDLY
jgi:acetolactate synthase regulatory subunit